jgi:hypothetical protein
MGPPPLQQFLSGLMSTNDATSVIVVSDMETRWSRLQHDRTRPDDKHDLPQKQLEDASPSLPVRTEHRKNKPSKTTASLPDLLEHAQMQQLLLSSPRPIVNSTNQGQCIVDMVKMLSIKASIAASTYHHQTKGANISRTTSEGNILNHGRFDIDPPASSIRVASVGNLRTLGRRLSDPASPSPESLSLNKTKKLGLISDRSLAFPEMKSTTVTRVASADNIHLCQITEPPPSTTLPLFKKKHTRWKSADNLLKPRRLDSIPESTKSSPPTKPIAHWNKPFSLPSMPLRFQEQQCDCSEWKEWHW